MDSLRATALSLATGKVLSARELERVGKQTSAEAARWAFEQIELRKRARSKFAKADEMLFVREALEQATHEAVAKYHASIFPEGVPVVDLTAGIGADLMALASRGPSLGFEIDSERAICAAHNVPEALVVLGDSLRSMRRAPRYAIADPARRVAGRRTLNLDEFSPSPRDIIEYLSDSELLLLKLTPMLADSALRSLGVRVEFVSFGGECREALVFSGSAANPGWDAVHLESGARLQPTGLAEASESPDSIIFDVDPAAVRAGCVGTLAGEFGLRQLGDSTGYLTGATVSVSPWLRPYVVLDHGSYDSKRVRAALRKHDGRVFEVKSRAKEADGPKIMREVVHEGTNAVSLIVWPQGRSLRYALTTPVLG